ncbi:MAG TPA: GNAT family N-acetyltransferase [Candidatus Eisenbacteria bacterium]|nr:GNAT family N-acetyltransferase [Candidatus Eisenbacteria bacterium]
MPRLPETILGRLLDVDEWNHVAIAAESAAVAPREGDPFGAARFIRLAAAPHAAEAAVVVADHLQRRGLGRLLLRALGAAARERGITMFRAEVLAVNVGVTALIRELGGDARPVSVGGAVAVYEVPLPDAPSEEGA